MVSTLDQIKTAERKREEKPSLSAPVDMARLIRKQFLSSETEADHGQHHEARMGSSVTAGSEANAADNVSPVKGLRTRIFCGQCSGCRNTRDCGNCRLEL